MKVQRVIANKVIKLSDDFKDTIEQMEINNNERFEKLEKNENDKSAAVVTILESVRVELDNHNDAIANLENEKTLLDTLIEQIDENIDNLSQKIDESIKKIKLIKEEEIETKRCVYDRYGYCKEKTNCMFFHSEETCMKYIKNGICTKIRCQKRHPRQCRYFLESIFKRGESCKYLHHYKRDTSDQCNRCEKTCQNIYYCEFCSKSFCSNCTVREAHVNNIYNYDKDLIKCSSIHLL